MPSFKNFEESLEGATRGQSFCMGSLWDFLIQLTTPRFWQVDIDFILYFLHCCSIWLLPVQINHFFQQRMFLVT